MYGLVLYAQANFISLLNDGHWRWINLLLLFFFLLYLLKSADYHHHHHYLMFVWEKSTVFFFVFGSQFFSFSKLIDDDPWESNSYFVSLSLILSTHYLFRWSSSNKIDILDQQRGVNWCWNNKNDQTNNKKH